MKNGDTIKDSVINILLFIRNYIMFTLLNLKREINKSKYTLLLQDDFKTHNTDLWSLTQYFGPINISYHWQYCSEDSVFFTEKGLILEQRYNPRTTNYWDGNVYNTKYDVGCITSKIPFGYGLYEFDIILPIGQSLWGSVWLSGYDSWPPEIDIMESYSGLDGRYDSRLNTNTWFGDINQSRARKSLIIKESKIYEPIKLNLIWLDDRIEFYMNGYKTRVITNKKVISYFRDRRMYVILNNAIRENMDADINQISKFNILNFKYYKIK